MDRGQDRHADEEPAIILDSGINKIGFRQRMHEKQGVALLCLEFSKDHGEDQPGQVSDNSFLPEFILHLSDSMCLNMAGLFTVHLH